MQESQGGMLGSKIASELTTERMFEDNSKLLNHPNQMDVTGEVVMKRNINYKLNS